MRSILKQNLKGHSSQLYGKKYPQRRPACYNKKDKKTTRDL